jgi:hypothetical protein
MMDQLVLHSGDGLLLLFWWELANIGFAVVRDLDKRIWVVMQEW